MRKTVVLTCCYGSYYMVLGSIVLVAEGNIWVAQKLIGVLMDTTAQNVDINVYSSINSGEKE